MKHLVPLLALACTGMPFAGIELTIYNNDLALVKDQRSIALAKGRSSFAWDGVAQTLDASSAVFSSPTAVSLEQNYRYDLVSRGVLLSKYLGKEVELVQEFVLQDGKTASTTLKGRILSIEGDRISSFESAGRILLDPPGRVVLPSLPEGLLVKPSLVLDLETSRNGSNDAELSYLCSGLSWKADYVAVVDSAGTRVDLDGLVTLENHSGASFSAATLKLVAGDVNRWQEPRNRNVRFDEAQPVLYASAPRSAKAVAAPQFAEQGLMEYHLYTLQRPADVLNREQKQVNFLSVADAASRKRFVFDESLYSRYWWWNRGNDDSRDGLKCAVILEVPNRKEQHMGMPLPKGVVRVYSQDRSGSLQFVGEDAIDHTPSGDTLRLSLGQAFDMRGARTIENSDQKGEQKTETVRVDLRNAKNEDVVIEVVEHQNWPSWKVKESSIPFEKRDASTIVFKVKVPAHGEAAVRYTYQASWK